MVNRKTNPRLLDLARRQRNEGFLEAEAKREEDARRLLEKLARRTREETAKRRRRKLENLKLDKEKRERFSSYIEDLNNYDKNQLETSLYAFVKHPDFPVIYNQLNTIPTIMDKWGFILRRAYEIGNDIDAPIGFTFQHNPISVKRRLEDYGINLLCLYFSENNRKNFPKDDCLIDGDPIMAICKGDYENCVVFQDRAGKSAAGLIKLPEINRTEPKFKIQKIEVDPVDLTDLDDWWKMEGKYE